MTRYKLVESIIDAGVVAVVRADSVSQAKSISEACMNGGITAIEITYTTPGASEVITSLKADVPDGVVIGAGTVLDAQTARLAMLAGADFIVSPSFDEQTAKLCNLYQTPYMPGCMTIKEMTHALQSGCDIVKLFPGRLFGPAFVKDVKAPLPQVQIMPTGGVSLDNIKDWIESGVCAVGVGGQLTNGTTVQIEETAKQFIEKLKEVRS